MISTKDALILATIQDLLADGTPESPVDMHEQNESLKFIVAAIILKNSKLVDDAIEEKLQLDGLL